MKRTPLLAALAILSAASMVRAEAPAAAVSSSVEPAAAAPKFYVSAFLGTTLLARPAAGEVRGPNQDLTPMAGLGYLLTDAWALELDVGPTFVAGSGYSGLAVMPGVVYTVNSYLYLCGRVMITVHPTPAVAAVPGVGLSYTFKSGWAPFAELDGVILRNPTGGADLSAAVSIGVARYF
jgi:hypothetical protein